MKRAQAQKVGAGLPELDGSADHLNDVDSGDQLLDE
jgi:hypothetical protein